MFCIPSYQGHGRCAFGSFENRKGFTVLELLTVVAVISILLAISLPTYFKFVQRARETSAISFLAKIKKAEEVFRVESPEGLYSASFDELETTGGIPPSTGALSRVEEDYRFDLAAGVNGGGEPFWNAAAAPLSGSPSAKWFYVDKTGLIRYSTGAPASASSPLLGS